MVTQDTPIGNQGPFQAGGQAPPIHRVTKTRQGEFNGIPGHLVATLVEHYLKHSERHEHSGNSRIPVIPAFLEFTDSGNSRIPGIPGFREFQDSGNSGEIPREAYY